MPNVRVESSVKCLTSSGSEISGRRGGSSRASSGGTLDGRNVVRRQRRRASARARLLVDQLHAREHLGETVDVGRRALLGDAHEQRVLHAGVVALQRVAGMDALGASLADDVFGGPSDPNGKLLECCLIWKHEREPEALLRIGGEAHAGLPHFAQPLRPEPREVDEPGEREQRLIRRDVRGGLLAADVLFAGLQGQDIGALAVDVGGLADDAAGHAPHIVRAGGDEAVVRPSVRLVVAGRLALTDRKRGAVRARGLEDAERERVDVRDR